MLFSLLDKEMGLSVKVKSLNVAGLTNMVKRKHIQKLLRLQRVNLVCLQETHLRKEEERLLKPLFFGDLYHAPAHCWSKEVVLVISMALSWVLISKRFDKEGQYVIL